MNRNECGNSKVKAGLLSSVLALGLWIGPTCVEAATPNEVAPFTGGSAGRQLQDIQEQLERARVEQDMAEHREKEKAGVEDNQAKPADQKGSVRFTLNEVNVDASEVLPTEKRDSIIRPYLGKECTLDDLYKIVEEINTYYAEKQYLTCRAYLPPQTIHNGVVRIALIEGKNGNITLEGNRHTNSGYILDRVPMEKGKVESMEGLTERLRRFNGTNDVQLHISLKAGTELGTTDYVISVREPQNSSFTLYADNAGNFTTGEFREGLFYTNRSLLGNRDALSLGYLRSKGLNSFNAGYSVPMGRSGTRMALSYSTNGTEVIDGQYHDWEIPVKGHASSYGVTLTQPLVVKDTMKVEASFGWQKMHSVTDIMDIRLIEDDFTDYTAGISATHYGKGRAFYHRHSFTHGTWDNGAPTTRINKPSADYNIYNLNLIYQQGAQHGQLFTARSNLQYSFTKDLRPSKQFYLGGIYSVRGYKENTVGGDNGATISLEYSVPVTNNKALSLYGFFDYGTLWGDNLAEHHTLCGTGLGLRARVRNFNVDLCVGIPLKRELDGYEKASKTRIHLNVSLQF